MKRGHTPGQELRGSLGGLMKHAPRALQAAPWLGMAALGALLWSRERPAKPGLSVQAEKTPEAFEADLPQRGRLASSPLGIPRKGWKDIVWRAILEINRDQLPRVAAGVTFYMLLSIVPALGVFVSLYGLIADVGMAQAQFVQLSTILPADVTSILGQQMVRLASSGGGGLSLAFLISLLLSGWTANIGVKALVDGLNVAYEEKERRNFFALTAITYVGTFGMLMFMVLVSLVLVAIPLGLRAAGVPGVETVWVPLRWVLLLSLAVGFFSALYRFAPCRRRPRWRWVVLGGVFAAVMWIAGSAGFSWYLNNLASYHATYGSLGAVIAFMMWIWFSVMVVLLGAELNAEVEHQTAIDSTAGPAKPMGQRGAAMADSVGLPLRGSLTAALQSLWRGGRRQAERVTGLIRRRRAEPPQAQPSSSSKAASRAA